MKKKCLRYFIIALAMMNFGLFIYFIKNYFFHMPLEGIKTYPYGTDLHVVLELLDEKNLESAVISYPEKFHAGLYNIPVYQEKNLDYTDYLKINFKDDNPPVVKFKNDVVYASSDYNYMDNILVSYDSVIGDIEESSVTDMDTFEKIKEAFYFRNGSHQFGFDEYNYDITRNAFSSDGAYQPSCSYYTTTECDDEGNCKEVE